MDDKKYYESIVDLLNESKEYGRTRYEVVKCMAEYFNENNEDPIIVCDIIQDVKAVMDVIHY